MVAHGSAWRVCIRTWRPYRGLGPQHTWHQGLDFPRAPSTPAAWPESKGSPGRAERPCACAWGGRSPAWLLCTGRFSSKGGPGGGGIFQGGRGKKETPGGLGGLRLKENQRKYKPPGGCSEGLVDAGRPRHHPHHNPNQHSRRAMRL